MTRDCFGNHVSAVNEFGSPVDADGVFASISLRGSFQVRYYGDDIDRVVVEVRSAGVDHFRMQLTLEQAETFAGLLAEGVADAVAAKVRRVAGHGDEPGLRLDEREAFEQAKRIERVLFGLLDAQNPPSVIRDEDGDRYATDEEWPGDQELDAKAAKVERELNGFVSAHADLLRGTRFDRGRA